MAGSLVRVLLIIFISVSVNSQVCPKQCDCDVEDGLNRAICVDQNIVSVNVGVPKEVQVYSLSRNGISELENFCFKEAGYTSVTILNLSYNHIFWIGIHAFSGLDKLVNLDLSNNRMRYVPADLFWDTPSLDSLDLSGNLFESIKNEPFLMHTKLQILNLNNCRMKSLPDRIFTRLPNIKKIDLSDNYMITLRTDIIKPMRKLQRIELQSEYWQCDTDFIALENWISSHGITYDKQCRRKLPKMSEKMISAVTERHDVDISNIWNITRPENKTVPLAPKTKTPFQKFDDEFPSFQAFIIGVEVGLAIGIVGTYIWLRSLCNCGHLKCRRPQSRRERRRARLDGDMRTNLLWSTVINPDLETPPTFRRQLSLPDRSPPFPVYGLTGLMAQEVENIDREGSETPPPPYQECRIVM